MKRLVDILGAACALVVTLPVSTLTAVVIRLHDGRPILYRSTRVGKDETEFTLYKFRTMTAGDGPAVTGAGDRRITRVGRLLRNWKIDELPQFWNVLVGEMSLVGPRPEDPRYVALYTPEQKRVLSVRPGITGPAAIAYRHEERLLAGYPDSDAAYVNEVLPAKLRLDLDYLEGRTLTGDLLLIARTVISIMSPNRNGSTQGRQPT